MPETAALDDERANEVATLLVRVYEIHEVIIAETGGLPGLRDAGHAIPDRLPLDRVVDFCVSVAEENTRIAAGELRAHARPRTSPIGFEHC
ncbi:MAG TPA: hypothetical protein VFL17_14435 [Anaerolineae bacterium]|nr:hypothetical protein [Anaerolineae bacterium]